MPDETRGDKATDVWCTPPWVVDPLGAFDLDPCACEQRKLYNVNSHIFAGGLEDPWNGRVWMNPPYSDIEPWMEKLAWHGNGIALVFARTETDWFKRHVWDGAHGILFVGKRIRFLRPDGTPSDSAKAPSCLVAYGMKNVNALILSGIGGGLCTGFNRI